MQPLFLLASCFALPHIGLQEKSRKILSLSDLTSWLKEGTTHDLFVFVFEEWHQMAHIWDSLKISFTPILAHFVPFWLPEVAKLRVMISSILDLICHSRFVVETCWILMGVNTGRGHYKNFGSFELLIHSTNLWITHPQLFSDVFAEDPLFQCELAQHCVKQEEQKAGRRTHKEKQVAMVKSVARIMEVSHV